MRNLPAILLVLFAAFCSRTEAADRITATVAVTNAPIGNTNKITINGNVRTFTNSVTGSPGTLVQETNSIPWTATNLLNQLTAYRVSQFHFLGSSASTNVRITGAVGEALTVTLAGGWGTVTYTTQTVASPTIVVRVPLSVEPASNRTLVASELVKGISDNSTNSFATNATATSNFITKGASPPQYIASEMRVAGNINNGASSLSVSNLENFGNAIRSFGSGGNSFQAGSNAVSAGTRSVAIGNSALATNTDSMAVGTSALATNTSATAVGVSTVAGQNGAAFGTTALASGNNSTSIGSSSQATGAGSSAIGNLSQATAAGTIALGQGPTATADYAIAIGNDSTDATGTNSIAIGLNATASNYRAAALGAGSVASHDFSTALGGYDNTGAATATTETNQIRIGTATHTVSAPGNLEVAGKTQLGTLTNGVFTGTNLWRGDVSYSRADFSSLANGNNISISFGTNHNIRLSGTLTATANICGIAGGRDGLQYDIFNDTGYSVVFTQNTVDPVAANRIENWDGNDVTLQNQGHTRIAYDTTDSRWKIARLYPNTAAVTNLSLATGFLATNTAPYGYITNPIVSGQFWTNTTGQRVVLRVAWTLSGSAVSGFPSLCMTNVISGEAYNPTNSFILTAVSSGRSEFSLSPNDYFIATNKSSGSATATVDSSFGVKQ